MVNITVTTTQTETPPEQGGVFPLHQGLGNFKIIKKDDAYLVEQKEFIPFISPPQSSKTSYSTGADALWIDQGEIEGIIAPSFARMSQALAKRNPIVKLIGLEHICEGDGFPQQAKLLFEAALKQKSAPCLGIWYVDQLLLLEAQNIYIGGEVQSFVGPLCTDYVRLASAIGKDNALKVLEQNNKASKVIKDQYANHFDLTVFFLSCILIKDISLTESVQEATAKAFELGAVVKTMGDERFKKLFEEVFEFHLKDSFHKNEWKKIIL